MSDAARSIEKETLDLPRTVYIVDDDDEVRSGLAFLLTSLGYDCHVYTSGRGLLGDLLTLEPGCIFLDFRMGGLTGLQVLAELRWMEIDWPVAVMTGHGDIEVGVKAMALGAIDFLEKPFDADTLTEVLERAFSVLEAKEAAAAR